LGRDGESNENRGESSLDRNTLCQVSWEIDVDSCCNGKMIREELKRNNCKKTLQAIDCSRDSNSLCICSNILIVVVANDNGLTFTSSNLHESRLYLWIERVFCHDH
jgi:hypothetical protein